MSSRNPKTQRDDVRPMTLEAETMSGLVDYAEDTTGKIVADMLKEFLSDIAHRPNPKHRRSDARSMIRRNTDSVDGIQERAPTPQIYSSLGNISKTHSTILRVCSLEIPQTPSATEVTLHQ
jgi:hypothetical protein